MSFDSIHLVSDIEDRSQTPDARLSEYLDILQSLHSKWSPHPGQEKIIQAVFRDHIKFIFIRCGRKFGKSETGFYILWRWAQTFPNSSCYYIAYEKDQAYEIAWKSEGGRIQNFGPESWIYPPLKTEMRINFRNGSFIKVDGSDNWKQYEGQTPSIIVADEVRLFKREWWETTEPNLAPKNAPILFMGTPPPDDDGLYNELEDEAIRLQAKGRGAHFHMPSWVNTKIPNFVAWLKDRKQRMIERGEHDEWLRQYEAKQVTATNSLIFPNFLEKAKFVPRKAILERIKGIRTLEWCLLADPALASVFGVLLLAYHRYENRIYVIDELYEKGPVNCTVSAIWPKIEQMLFYYAQESTLVLSSLSALYDSAAAWFAAEVLAAGGLNFTPTKKIPQKDVNGIPQINELINGGHVVVADECVNFTTEMSKYKRDDKGRIPKYNDHLIDCFRYGVIYLQPATGGSVDSFVSYDEDYEDKQLLNRESSLILTPSQQMWDKMVRRFYGGGERALYTEKFKTELEIEEESFMEMEL